MTQLLKHKIALLLAEDAGEEMDQLHHHQLLTWEAQADRFLRVLKVLLDEVLESEDIPPISARTATLLHERAYKLKAEDPNGSSD